jgi:hypothetical protein
MSLSAVDNAIAIAIGDVIAKALDGVGPTAEQAARV